MKKFPHNRIAVLTLLCLTFCIGYAQEEPLFNAIVQVDQEPKPLNMQDVQRKIGYPQIARDAGIEGNVVVRILVDEEGKYVRHLVLNGVHPVLEQSVSAQLPKLTFSPAIKEGEPVKFWVNLPFAFKLIGGKKEVPEGIQVVEENSPNGEISSTPVGSGDLILFPNPSTGKLEFSFTHSTQVRIESIQILDQQGKQVFEKRISFEGKHWTYLMNLPELSAGTYHVQLRGGEEMWSQQWVKK